MTEPSFASSPPQGHSLDAALDWQRALLDTWAITQRSQCESLGMLQKAIAEFNQDLLDRWTCRFGGGVPLDG